MIILSSFGFRSPIVSQKIREYVSQPEDKKVLMIPFAGFNNINTGIRESDGLVAFGFSAENIFILDAGNAAEAKNTVFDYIYVPGGDPFKLLFELREINFLGEILRMLKNGSTYIGVSAGASLATVDIGYVAQLEDDNYSLSDYSGLGLIDDCVLCHIDQYSPATVIACKSVCRDRKLFGIRNDEIAVLP